LEDTAWRWRMLRSALVRARAHGDVASSGAGSGAQLVGADLAP
jgi:hypothetical protein